MNCGEFMKELRGAMERAIDKYEVEFGEMSITDARDIPFANACTSGITVQRGEKKRFYAWPELFDNGVD